MRGQFRRAAALAIGRSFLSRSRCGGSDGKAVTPLGCVPPSPGSDRLGQRRCRARRERKSPEGQLQSLHLTKHCADVQAHHLYSMNDIGITDGISAQLVEAGHNQLSDTALNVSCRPNIPDDQILDKSRSLGTRTDRIAHQRSKTDRGY